MNQRPIFGSVTTPNPESQMNQPSSQSTQSQQIPIPPNSGLYMSTPMPPPVDPLLISQQIQSQIPQQNSSIPQQYLDTTYIHQNQNNQFYNPYVESQTTEFQKLPGYNNVSEIIYQPTKYNQNTYNYNYNYQYQQQSVIIPPNQIDQQQQYQQQSAVNSSTQIDQQQKNIQELSQSSIIILNKQDSFSTQSSQILENSRIISNSKIKEMDINSNTHSMIIIEEKANEFLIQPFDEKLKKEKQKNKQLVNSNFFIIQNNNTTIPEFQCQERLCQLHSKPIDKICAEQDCKENNDLLLCQDCARDHKGHNLFDIPEALFLILKSQDTLSNDDQVIETIKSKTFQQFKILKSNITWQLKEIEDQLQEGFDKFKQFLQEKKSSYQQAFNDLQFGGLSKMVEQTNFLFDQGLFLEVNLNSNESQYQQLAAQLDKVKLQMIRFEQLIEDNKQDHVSIKLNNAELLIENQRIQNLNDLYFQIKIDALKYKFTNILDQELLMLQNNKATRLKGNQQEINLKDQQNIQIISYQQI